LALDGKGASCGERGITLRDGRFAGEAGVVRVRIVTRDSSTCTATPAPNTGTPPSLWPKCT
jgi:hypothetical protein